MSTVSGVWFIAKIFDLEAGIINVSLCVKRKQRCLKETSSLVQSIIWLSPVNAINLNHPWNHQGAGGCKRKMLLFGVWPPLWCLVQSLIHQPVPFWSPHGCWYYRCLLSHLDHSHAHSTFSLAPTTGGLMELSWFPSGWRFVEPRGQFAKPAAAAVAAAASTLPHSWVELLGKTITSALVHFLLGDRAPSMSICL